MVAQEYHERVLGKGSHSRQDAERSWEDGELKKVLDFRAKLLGLQSGFKIPFGDMRVQRSMPKGTRSRKKALIPEIT